MHESDALALRVRSGAGEDWACVAAGLADARLGEARRALAEEDRITALSHARWAAGAAWCSQLADHRDTSRKRSLYRGFTGAVSFVASLDGMQRVEIPFATGKLVGWLRRPAAGPGIGTIIVWGGLANWGAAYLRMADVITARGFACLLAEGPGQGEPRLEHGLYLDEQAADGYTRFVDAVTADAALPGPVGIIGNSLGGLFAAFVSARDPRVAACVVNGAPLGPGAMKADSIRQSLSAACGCPEECAREILRKFRFDPALQPISCPVLSLHGGADRVVGRDEAQAFADASTRGRLVSWPDGEHTIYNHARERDTLVADWLAGELTSTPNGHRIT
jgi:alpha-beta hydrolase superfamily lysophospholipase